MEGEKEFLSNIEKLKADVLACCRNPEHPPRILPVSKTQPIERILPLKQAGFTAIGENHAQEILEKFPALGADFEIHMIGRLQTNKIKYIINRVCLVQSLDSIHLAQALDARAQACGIVMPVLVQLNTGREAQKGGLPPEEIVAFARECARLPGLSVRGLMAVMPKAEDPESIRPLFRQARQLFEQLRAEAIDGVDCRELSMGMSHDYRVAAQEGATRLRLGAAIFGERKYH